MITVAELAAILLTLPQGCFLEFDNEVTVWGEEDGTGYLGMITADDDGVWRYEPYVGPSEAA